MGGLLTLFSSLIVTGLLISGASGALIFDESSSQGDLSDDAAMPTLISSGLALGESDIELSTSATDPDFFTIRVAEGTLLTAIYLVDFVSGTSDGNVGFFGFQDGSSISPFVPDPADISFHLYGLGDIFDPSSDEPEIDLLDRFTASDFTSIEDSSLAAGDYTFWVNETNAAPNSSAFIFVVEPVPEPSTTMFLGLGFGLACCRRERVEHKDGKGSRS